MLVCPVRGCHLPLVRGAHQVRCERGHSFDLARSGYINLLQPQDKRSKHPGDTPEAIEGRRRLHDRGVTAPFLHSIADMLAVSTDDVVLDTGCGEGFYLGTLASQTGCDGHGVDISIPAVQAAAKRYPGGEWVVANADRLLPYSNGSFTVVMSITARMNPGEFRRVLRDDGRLLVALSSADDLVELRGIGRDRVGRTLDLFASDFFLVDRRRVVTTAELDAGAVQDVLHSIYRPPGARAVEAMPVTFGLDLLLLQPKSC